MKELQQRFLNFILFHNIDLWDTKRYTSATIESKYKIVELGDCIQEQNKKYKIFENTDESFGILGVNNQTGIFDAYISKGKEINQPYKKMEVGWIAYNPYRINVGSIGIRKHFNQHEYISPAYVVFSCEPMLMPDYLFMLFKSKTFNRIINESTTGSVRQNLSFDILKKLRIPLPSLEDQERIVSAYNEKIAQAKELEREVDVLERGIEKTISDILGNNVRIVEVKTTGLQFTLFSKSVKWGFEFLRKSNIINNVNFPTKQLKEVCSISSGGTPSRSNKEYYNGNIPWIKTGEVVNEVIFDTEEKITNEAIENSSAKIYPKDSLIIAMYGQGATRGRTAKLGIEASTNQACAVLFNIDNNIIITDYLWIFLMYEYDRLRAMASGNNQPNLNAGMINDYQIQIPPFEIQQEIIDMYFDSEKKIKEIKQQAASFVNIAQQEFEEEIFNSK